MSLTEATVGPRRVAWKWDALRATAKLAVWFLSAAAFGMLFSVYYAAAHRVGLENPDNVSFVLEGQDLLKGNWNLHGWTLVNTAWWPVPPVVYAGALLTRGFLRAPFYVAALTWAVTVACVVWAAIRPFRGPSGLFAGFAAFLLVGLPSGDALIKTPLEFIFATPFEALTTAGSILSLALFWAALAPTPTAGTAGRFRTSVLAGAAVVIAGCAIASDTLGIATIIIPLLAFSVLVFLQNGSKRRAAAAAAFAAAALIASRLLLWSLRATHGLTLLQPVNWVTFAPFDTFLTRNVPLTAQSLIAFYGAYWFGRPVLAMDTLVVMVHFGVLLFVVWSVWRSLRVAYRGSTQDQLTGILALGFASNLVAFTTSTLPQDIGSSRYLLTVLPFGGVVAARAGGELFEDASVRKKMGLCGAVLLFTVASWWSFQWWFEHPGAVSPRGPVIEWLVAHDLRTGYAPYTDAAPMTIESNGRLAVRPVEDSHQRLVPVTYSSRSWYQEPARFFVIRDGASGVTLASAGRTFGTNYTLHRIGSYQIAVWPRDWTLLEPEHHR